MADDNGRKQAVLKNLKELRTSLESVAKKKKAETGMRPSEKAMSMVQTNEMLFSINIAIAAIDNMTGGELDALWKNAAGIAPAE